MRNDQLAVLLRDFAKRANQWADVLEKEEQGEGPLKPLVTLLETPSSVEERGPSTARSVPWRRGDYFFCESCGQRKQWFRNTAPWRGAICASCYNAELARIEAARGRKA